MKQMFWPCCNKFIKRIFAMQMLPLDQHTTLEQAVLGGIPGEGGEIPLHSVLLHSRVIKCF